MLCGSVGVAHANFDSVGTVFDGFDGDDTSYAVGIGYDYRVGVTTASAADVLITNSTVSEMWGTT